ncbi:MAG: YeeE/YedE family protein [Pseudomonadales bacterium]|nr:YeeE/YedE family protein [Gammaproteobacteria bacterium]NNL56726.1 YeeE/YedE family protein [Pseudomonadales bacterium]
MGQAVAALACGLVFGAGLALSGMTDTQVVLAFFDFFGMWNPALAWVMLAALAITLPGYALVLRRERPLLHQRFELPSNKHIDTDLLAGAALFGIGWGLYGYCPGPAIAALAYLQTKTFAFVAAMVLGAYLGSRIKSAT